jgi:S-formylglutathione hydrolase FrmB
VDGPAKTLILLHGGSDAHSAWAHRSSILRYAEAYDIAVIMPECQNSIFQNMVYGLPYADYIFEELPELAAKMFDDSIKREDLMIAGLSMGGYGAMYGALTYPEKFSVVGTFSGGLDVKGITERMAGEENGGSVIKDAVFGGHIPDSSDLFMLSEKVAKAPVKPRVFMTTGTEDFIHDMSVHMHEHLVKLGWDVTYEEWPGTHEWGFWDVSIQKFLKWVFSK